MGGRRILWIAHGLVVRCCVFGRILIGCGYNDQCNSVSDSVYTEDEL